MKSTSKKISTFKTPQERLEIREFILDSNLYLVGSSLYMVSALSVLLYCVVLGLFFSQNLNQFIFLQTTMILAGIAFFTYLGFKAIYRQKQYISRLENIFEDKNRGVHYD